MGKGRRVLTGTHFEMGNWACVEGAIAAGCTFAAGYPITPASEIANRLSERIPRVGGSSFRPKTRSAPSARRSALHGPDKRP